MMKRDARAAVLAGAVCLSFLCLGAQNPFGLSSKKNLKARIESLERDNANLQRQVADLSMKVSVLTQRVNSAGNSSEAGAFPKEGISRGPYTSDLPGLEVVRLEPEALAPAAKPDKPRGNLFVVKTSGDSTTYVEHGEPLPGTRYVPLPDPALTMTEEPPPAESPSPPVTATLAAPREPPPATAPDSSAEELSSYEEIKRMCADGADAEARPLMENYLASFENGAHEDEVAFLLGTWLFNTGEYEKAVRVLKVVVDDHYESSKAPDALYHVGLSHLKLGRTEEAGDAFREIKILYPFSQAAQLADTQLAACCN